MATQEDVISSVNAAQEPARYIRVTVVDHTREGRPAVTIRMPLGVAKWGLKMAQTLSPQIQEARVDWDSLNALIQEGARGELVHMDDDANHKTVDVWVE